MAKKKRLSADSITNPLEESAFFRTPSEPEINRTTTRKSAATQRGKQGRGVGRPPLERPTKRQSYEIFEDQLMALRRLRSTRELETGEKVSMSGLVREAIDALLAENGF